MPNIKEEKARIFKEIAERPGMREPYLKMAKLGYGQSDWLLTYAMVKNGLAITQKSDSDLTEPECWGYAFDDLGAISAYYLDLFEESREYAVKALEMEPENPRLESNLRLIEAKITTRTVAPGKEG